MPVYLTSVDLAESSPFRIAHVLGTSGVLNSVGVSSDSGFHYFKIEIDSKTVVDTHILDPFSRSSQASNSLAVNLPFENSLNIYVHSVDTYPQAKFSASFITNGGDEILADEKVSYAQNEIDCEFSRLVLRSAPGAHVYFVETALQPSKWCKIDLEKDTLFAGESLRGRLMFPQDVKATATITQRPRLIMRLAEMRRPLGSLDVADNEHNFEFEWLWSDFEAILQDALTSGLMQRGGRIDFEVIADIPRFLNYPARFSFV